MRRYDLIGLIGLFCLLAACTPSQPEWRLVWEENFDQINDFDPAVWSKIPRGTADWNNYMSDFDSLYEMRNGNLVLRGIQNLTQPQDTAPFLTGGVYTKGKMGFMDGRLEIKAKLNGATGAWPAFGCCRKRGSGRWVVRSTSWNGSITTTSPIRPSTRIIPTIWVSRRLHPREVPARSIRRPTMCMPLKCMPIVSVSSSTISIPLPIRGSRPIRRVSSPSINPSISCSICS